MSEPAVQGITPAERRSALEAFQRALRRESHVLYEQPDLLWQQMYNRLQWEDGPMPRLLAPELAQRSKTPFLRLRTPLPESPALIRTLVGHTGEVWTCAYSPDGATIASGSEDHTIILWDAASGRKGATLTGHADAVTACAFSPDGATLVSAGRDGMLKIWDLSGRQEKLTVSLDRDMVTSWNVITSCVFTRDGAVIVAADFRGALRFWDAHTGLLLPATPIPDEVISFKPEADLTLSGVRGMAFRGWYGHEGSGERATATRSGGVVSAISWSGDTVCSTRSIRDDRVTMWDVQRNEKTFEIGDDRRWISSCSFSPDDTLIVCSGLRGDFSLKIWDAHSGEDRGTLIGHKDDVTACSFSPDGSNVVSCSRDFTVKIWNALVARGADQTGNLHRVKVAQRFSAFAFRPDGATIVSGTMDGLLTQYDTQTAKASGDFQLRDVIWGFNPDASLVLTLAEREDPFMPWKERTDRTFTLWNAHNGEYLRDLLHSQVIFAHTLTFEGRAFAGFGPCVFSLDGGSVMTIGGTGLKRWDVQSSSEEAREIPIENLQGIYALSPDGSTLLVLTDGLVSMDIDTDRVNVKYDASLNISRLTQHVCAFSPDGMAVVAGTSDGVLTIWDAQTGRKSAHLKGHTKAVEACAFSPDGSHIFSVSRDRTLRVWDRLTGREQARMPQPTDLICLAVHPWQPLVVIGDAVGELYFVDLMGIEYGPIIVTATDAGNGLAVRCPVCRYSLALGPSQLGTVVACPQMGCDGQMRVNPFVITMVRPLDKTEPAESPPEQPALAPMSKRPTRRGWWPFGRSG